MNLTNTHTHPIYRKRMGDNHLIAKQVVASFTVTDEISKALTKERMLGKDVLGNL